MLDHHAPAVPPAFVVAAYDLLGSQDDPSFRRSMDIIEQVRVEVVAALTHLHLETGAATAITAPISTWDDVERHCESSTVYIIDDLSRSTCCRTPLVSTCLAISVVASWRRVGYTAVASGHGTSDWTTVTDRAEETIRLCRWIYSGDAERILNPS